MNVAPALAESMLRTALETWNDREDALTAVLDELPVATYITDLDGVVFYLHSQAERCRRLAKGIGEARTRTR